jgi:hypothetical protein
MQGLSQANRKVILPANLLDFKQWLAVSGIK